MAKLMHIILWLVAFSSVSSPLLAMADSGLRLQPAHLQLGEVTEGQQVEAILYVRNQGDSPLMLDSAGSACGCTKAKLKQLLVPAHGFVTVHVQIDTTAKLGTIKKQVFVKTMTGEVLSSILHLTVLENPHNDLQGGLFKGSCRSCHYDPAMGEERPERLFSSLCAMCHGEQAKGAYAPRLRQMSASHLDSLIRNGSGRPQMPGFAKLHGGPLTDAQIQSLVDWLMRLNQDDQRKE